MFLKAGVKFRAPITATVAALLATTGQAATVGWYGSVGMWTDTWSWSEHALPGANDDVQLAWPYSIGADVNLSSSYPSYLSFTEIGSLTIGSYSRLRISGATLQIGGNIVNDGALVLVQTYSSKPSTLKVGSNTTLSGAGTLRLNYNTLLDLNASTLTIGSAQTVRGAGDISNGNLINRGHLIAEGVLHFNSNVSSIDNTAGTITVSSASVLSMPRTRVTGGLISTSSSGAIYGAPGSSGTVFSRTAFEGDAVLGGSLTLEDVINKGMLRTTGNSSAVTIKGTVVNDGEIYATTSLAVQGNTSLEGSGTVRLVRESFGFFSTIGTIDVAANSTLTIGEDQTVFGSGRFRGASDSHIINQGSVRVDGVVYAYLEDGGFDNSSGSIAVAAGATFGTTGTLLLGDASTLTFEIGSNASNHGAMYLWSSAPQVLDGSLLLKIGYAAQIGDSFSLLKYTGGVTGSFDQVIAAGYSVSTSFNAADLVVTITGIAPVPEPASWMMAGTGLLLIGRRLAKFRTRQADHRSEARLGTN